MENKKQTHKKKKLIITTSSYLALVYKAIKAHLRQKPLIIIGPRQANLVLIAYASSEGSGEPAHPRSLARTFAARSYKQWVKRNLQTESQIPGPSEWLGMRSWNLSWRNARRHKFAWRGSIIINKLNHNYQSTLYNGKKMLVCNWLNSSD